MAQANSANNHYEGITRYATWAARMVVLAAFFDLFMQFPIMAPHARDLGASATLVGVIVAAYSVTNLFGNLAAGFVLDRWGRRLPVLLGLGITALAVLSYAVVRSPEQLLVARAIHGLGAATLTPGAFAILGDRAVTERRARAMALAGALIAIPAMIGPPAAGLLRDAWGANAVFLADGAFVIATLIIFATTSRGAWRPPDSRTRASDAEPLPALWRSRLLWSAYAAQFAITVGVGVLVTHLPLVLEDQGETAARSGISFAIYALVSMLVMASPIGGASDRIGRFIPLIVGLFGVAAGLAVVGTSGGYAGIAIGMAVFGLGYGLVFPAAAALVTEATGPRRRGRVFGVFYAVYSLGVAAGAAGSGRLAGQFEDMAGLPFFAAAVVVLAALPIVATLRYATRSRG